MRIFLYECISAGALGPSVPPSLQREGWAMLSAVVEDFQRLPDVETVTLIDERLPGTLGDVCTRIPWTGEAERFRNLATGCDWTLVIAPEFDNLLLDRSRTVLEVGGRLLGSSPHAIGVTGDKRATASLWHLNSVPHPMTELIDPIEFAPFGPPWVIKPRHGAGSQATYLIRDHGEQPKLWQAARREWPKGDLIVQQYVPGEPVSVALLIGPTQTIALMRSPFPLRGRLAAAARFVGTACASVGDRRGRMRSGTARLRRRRSRSRRAGLGHRDQSAADHVVHRAATSVQAESSGVDAALFVRGNNRNADMVGRDGAIRSNLSPTRKQGLTSLLACASGSNHSPMQRRMIQRFTSRSMSLCKRWLVG